MFRKITITALFCIILSSSIKAWVYPEHRVITLVAISKLDSARRVILNQLWLNARKGHENRLDTLVANYKQNVKPSFIDYAAWPAIAGDHSTSPANMVNNILKTNWILNVADITAKLRNGIAKAKNKSEIEWELRNSDLRLLRADPEYVSRAGSNYVHFLLARQDANTSSKEYFDMCYDTKSDINLVGAYKLFHSCAILKANRLATEVLTPAEYSALSLSTLADEAFALHFLQDAFSAGHVAGTWGSASQRKGTHDYYDEFGLEVTTWAGKRMITSGDAYMRPCDTEIAGDAVCASIEQVLDVVVGKIKPTASNDQSGVFTPDTFNIAKATKMPHLRTDESLRELSNLVLVNTPVPGLSTGVGEIPRFRSEIGPFIGISPAVVMSAVSGGFGMAQKTVGPLSGLEFAVHMGLGTDGVLNKSGDGLVFLDLGWRLDKASSIKLSDDPVYSQFGSILSAFPSRETLYGRFRMPFYLVPGDLLVAAPFLYFLAPNVLNTMVATAGQGGLIPWQTGIITPIGRFQFMLGREVGVSFYGSLRGKDAFLVPDDRALPGGLALITLRSTKFDFPILEYRPMRTFSRRQSANLFVQLTAGIDIPGKVTMKSLPNYEPMQLKTVVFIGIRLGFDWRYYVSKK